MKVRFFRPNIEPWDLLIIDITIIGLTIFQLSIGKYYALTQVFKGFVITLFGFTIQVTDK